MPVEALCEPLNPFSKSHEPCTVARIQRLASLLFWGGFMFVLRAYQLVIVASLMLLGCGGAQKTQAFCEKHADTGDQVSCNSSMHTVQIAVGASQWEIFEACALNVDKGNVEALDTCFTEDMEKRLLEHINSVEDYNMGMKAVVSPEALCERHAKADELEECTKGMSYIEEALGDELWSQFSVCADAAGDKGGMERCLTEDMEKALQESFKKKLDEEGSFE